MSAAVVTERPWMRRTGLPGIVDGGTVSVLLLWALMLFLLPSRPQPVELAGPSVPDCMISLWPEPLADLPLALRPDLVALPSAVSFGAAGLESDSLYGVPPFLHRMEVPLPAATTGGAEVAARFWLDRIRSVAAQEAGRSRLPEMYLSPPSGTIAVSPSVPVVLYTGGLGNTRLSAAVFKGIGGLDGARRFEAEFWVAFDPAGRPVDIFLEKSSGDPAADRELVRRMWNPANWTGASGRGRVLIRQ